MPMHAPVTLKVLKDGHGQQNLYRTVKFNVNYHHQKMKNVAYISTVTIVSSPSPRKSNFKDFAQDSWSEPPRPRKPGVSQYAL